MPEQNVSIKNRKALFEFQLLQTYIAGIQLLGTEIKSLREGKGNIADAFCVFIDDELFVRNMHIAEYSHGSHNNHEAKRQRKLLMKRNEMDKLKNKLKEKGLTVIPIHLFINEKGLAKLEVALAKGKKLYDKREDIKKKDTNRELDRIKKSYSK